MLTGPIRSHPEQPPESDVRRDLNALLNVQRVVPRSPRHLWQLVYVLFGVRIPFARCCPHHKAPFEAFSDAFFAHQPISVWHASRGFGGKSFLLALLSLTEQVLLGASVNLLGGSGEQSKRVHRYMTGEDPNAKGQFWQAPNAPRWLLASDPTQTETNLINGGYLKALMASQKSVRGPHPQRLRLDETDEMDLEIFDAAMGQTMGRPGIPSQTVCSSTWQNPNGTMTEILKRAAEKGWPVYRWCYRESMAAEGGWLDPLEVERKRQQVTKAMWETEYELQEPNPEGLAIDREAVRDLFDLRLSKGVRHPGVENVELTFIRPGPGRKFYHGSDWAKTRDWTVIHSMWRNADGQDVLAAWTRTGRRPWDQMIGFHNARVKRYGGPSVHDATGVGSVCADYLEVPSQGFDFSAAKARADMLSSYIAAIERRDIVYPAIDYVEGEHKFATWNEIYGSGHLPDTIAAGAMAWLAKKREGMDAIKIGMV